MRRDISPVWRGYFADPFVLPVGNEFFAYGTSAPDARGSSGEHFQILHSDDLETWKTAEWALPTGDGVSCWAPEVAVAYGTYYLYYSCGGEEGEGHRIHVAMSNSPTGPFTPSHGRVVRGEAFSIDPHPFQDPADGRRYMFFAKDYFDGRVGTGIAAAPLSSDMRSIDGAPATILRASADWQIFERDRFWYGRRWDAWHTVEGPCVVHREGRYWLFYSGGLWKGDSYGISWAVADSVLGPYEEPAPTSGPKLLRSGEGLRGPGHNSVVVGPDGKNHIVFHAWDPAYGKRQMHIARLGWNEDGPFIAN